jgi:hypothetical protein
MGMFDYVICKYPLPNKEVQEIDFQTKSFPEPYMDIYIIDEAGYLIKEEKEYYTIPEKDRAYYGKPEWENPLYRFIGSVGTKSKRLVYLEDFIGIVNFYTYIDDGIDEEGYPINTIWYEYNAYFTNGQLDSIEKVNNAN